MFKRKRPPGNSIIIRLEKLGITLPRIQRCIEEKAEGEANKALLILLLRVTEEVWATEHQVWLLEDAPIEYVLERFEESI